jgi:hypothetical protein
MNNTMNTAGATAVGMGVILFLLLIGLTVYVFFVSVTNAFVKSVTSLPAFWSGSPLFNSSLCCKRPGCRSG